MTNQLVSKRIQSFLALLGLEVGLTLFISFELHYCCTSNKINPKMTLSIRQSYLSKIIHHSFSEFRKTDIGEHLSVLNNDIQLIESNGFTSILYPLFNSIHYFCFQLLPY